MSDQKHGKDFEKLVQDHLKTLQARLPLMFHRFADTKAARVHFLPTQPGDFFTIHKGRVCLLECKASVAHASLKSCLASMVEPQQVGHHKIWQRAGARTFFFFRDAAADDFEIWDGIEIIEARATGRSLPKDGALFVENRPQFLRAVEALL